MSQLPPPPSSPSVPMALEVPEPPRWRRWVVGLVVVLLGGAAAVVWLGRDLAEVGDADLLLEPAPLADAESAIFHLGQAGQALREASGSPPTQDALDGWIGIGIPAVWDPGVIEGVLRGAAPALVHAAKAARTSGQAQLVAPGGEADISVAVLLTKLLSLRAEVEQRAGDHAAALETADTAARLGVRLIEGPAPIVQFLTGGTCLRIGLHTVRRVSARAGLPAERLDELRERLGRVDVRAATARMLQAEYTVCTKAIAAVGVSSYAFQPNRTAARFAAHFRALREASQQPLASAQMPPPPTQPPAWIAVAMPNSAGELLGESLLPASERVLGFAASYAADVVATRLWLRLLAHRARHGALPESLDPVPLDPYTGAGIAWDAASRRFWFAGADGVDDGGGAGPPQQLLGVWRMDDPTFVLPAVGK